MAYNLLKGKRGIVFGALDEHSIAWQAAQKIKEEENICLHYQLYQEKFLHFYFVQKNFK